MAGVMNIVIPLGRKKFRLTVGLSFKIVGAIAIVFQDQMDMSFRSRTLLNRQGDFFQDIGIGAVENAMNGVKTQAVKVIFLQPVENICNIKIPHRSTAFTGEPYR